MTAVPVAFVCSTRIPSEIQRYLILLCMLAESQKRAITVGPTMDFASTLLDENSRPLPTSALRHVFADSVQHSESQTAEGPFLYAAADTCVIISIPSESELQHR
jgi:hypothetical protein